MSTATKAELTPNLTNCDKEPIHIIGHIQSIGYVLVLNRDTLEVVQASKNINKLVKAEAEELIGHSVDHYFSYEFLDYLGEIVKPEYEKEHYSLRFEHNGTPYLLTSHISEGFLVLEIEKDNEEERENSYLHYSSLVENILNDIDKFNDIPNVCKAVIARLHEVTGFNRMMVYRFDDEGHGEVIAEKIEPGMDSYLGLKFPATDIPAQARKLYLVNTMRGIWSVDDEPSPIVPAIRHEDGKPLDLTYTFLRSVSPIHVQYLKNMGVHSSFSISIIVKGRLWGLILCHHTERPVKLDIHQRKSCTFIGKVLSHKISGLLEQHLVADYRKKLLTFQRVTAQLMSNGDIHEAIQSNHEKLFEAFEASGYALYYDDKTSKGGMPLRDAWVSQLLQQLQLQEENVIASNNLRKDFPHIRFEESDPAGAMVISISHHLNECLILFRPQEEKQVHWAGKPANMEEGVKDLNPRNSFEKWTELLKDHSRKWTRDEQQFADEFRSHLIESLLSISKTNNVEQPLKRHNLRLRLVERTTELEEKNRQLQEELLILRQTAANTSLAREIAEEKTRLHPVRTIKIENK